MQYYLKQFAANYDCNAYGAGGYNSTSCATGTDGGGLVPTGDSVMIGLLGGALLIVVALTVLFRLLRKKRQS